MLFSMGFKKRKPPKLSLEATKNFKKQAEEKTKIAQEKVKSMRKNKSV